MKIYLVTFDRPTGKRNRRLLVNHQHKWLPYKVAYILVKKRIIQYIGATNNSRVRLCSHEIEFDLAIVIECEDNELMESHLFKTFSSQHNKHKDIIPDKELSLKEATKLKRELLKLNIK